MIRTSVFDGIPMVTSFDPTAAVGSQQYVPSAAGWDISPYLEAKTEVWWQGITSGASFRLRWQESNDGTHWQDVWSYGVAGVSGAAVASGMIALPQSGTYPGIAFDYAARGRWVFEGTSVGPGPASGGAFGATFFGRSAISAYQ